jgi:hypothetical protein
MPQGRGHRQLLQFLGRYLPDLDRLLGRWRRFAADHAAAAAHVDGSAHIIQPLTAPGGDHVVRRGEHPGQAGDLDLVVVVMAVLVLLVAGRAPALSTAS